MGAGFVNGGFEDGNNNGWTVGGGLWSAHPGWPQNFNDYTDPAQYMGAIVTPGLDPQVGSSSGLNMVFSGNYAMRVNDSSPNYHVSTLKQTIVNYTDTNMFFAWAAVLEQSHGPTDSGNFTLQLRDDTAGSNLISRSYSSATAGSIFTNYGGWYATAWQIETLDVSANVGHDFTISVLASDCALGGHGGYVYVDAFGATVPVSTPVLTVDVTPVGSGTTTGSGACEAGSNVLISATANSNWSFTQWNDGNTNASRTIVMPSSNITYTATFVPFRTLTLTPNPASGGGTVTGGGQYPPGTLVTFQAIPTSHWHFVSWSDGDTNASRTVPLNNDTQLTATFTNTLYVLLQQGSAGPAGQWVLGTAAKVPVQWMPMAIPVGNPGYPLITRSLNENRVLLQVDGGCQNVGLWALDSAGAPTNWWDVASQMQGWIIRGFDGNRVLLQQGDGGIVGIWTLGAGNTPASWKMLSLPVTNMIARAIYGQRVLVQIASTPAIGYWTLDGSDNVTAWVPIVQPLPYGWILRAMSANNILLQNGDGGEGGLWDIDGSGNPTAWYPISPAMPGWILWGLDQR
jgi:hypothetical protein